MCTLNLEYISVYRSHKQIGIININLGAFQRTNCVRAVHHKNES